MMLFSGTVQNAVKLDMLNNKWEQKKNTGNALSKEELNKRENWTPEQRQLNEYQEQLKKQKEGNKRTEIYNKISSGQKLSAEEEQYLASFDPKSLSEYRQTQAQRKAYEEKLKNCKTKDDVQRLKQTSLGVEFSSLKKVLNDPYIPLSEKLKKAQQALGKTRNFQEAEAEFIESGAYDKLPTEAEQAIERAKESNAQNEINNAMVEDASERKEELVEENSNVSDDSLDVKEASQKLSEVKSKEASNEDTGKEIEEIYNRLVLRKQLEDDSDKPIVTEQEKKVGKKFNLTV
ncbi:MAG: hypothetical protein PUG10_07190 [Lachnospiraceae bacterium]|nr:hypothetical protein [Lachnospiraceae bacterium]